MPKQHRVPDMPREYIVRHPKVIGLNTAAYGILCRLLDHFWITDCAPLPEVEGALFLLARANRPTWSAHLPVIKEILQDVIPELLAARVRQRERRSILLSLSEKGNASRRAQRLKKRINAAPVMTPIHEPKLDQPARSTERLASVAAPVKGGFVDKR